MSNEIRVRQNFLGGKVDDNPLTSGATTLTSSALAALVAIGSTQHAAITLDPDGLAGAPEIVYVTAHTASATTATILRGQESTTARAHNQDIDWIHGATIKDFTGETSWTAPSLSNSWVNFGGAYGTAGYMLDGLGWVHLRGVVKSGSAGTIFTLPAGYRPEMQIQVATFSNAAFAYLDIATTGAVIAGGYSNVSVSLDNIHFKQYQ